MDECDRPQYGRGWCEPHYARWRRHGGLEDQRAATRDPDERFWEKTTPGPPSLERPDLGPCLLWTGPPNGSGYGTFRVGGRSVGAHVYAVTMTGTPVPPGHEPDHLCYVPLCVRQSHIEVVTAAENKRRQRNRRAVMT